MGTSDAPLDVARGWPLTTTAAVMEAATHSKVKGNVIVHKGKI